MNTAQIILNWYKKNQRPLPWRKHIDSYNTWVAEIIMQQTRINQGLPYYNRFIEKFPNVTSLAKASEDELLLLWQGLGYYSRARNMHITAKYVVKNLNGEFPTSYNELIKLKGIGEYTAAAIASLSTNENVAAIDGNVNRVVTRIFDIDTPIDKAKGKSEIKAYCNELISNVDAKYFNQAIMDFGAMVCTPKQTQCDHCPLVGNCMAYANKTVALRPIKSNKVKVKPRHLTYVIAYDKENVYINKRNNKDIWKGLYEFILIEDRDEFDMNNLHKNAIVKQLTRQNNQLNLEIIVANKHQLSHQTLFTKFICLKLDNLPDIDDYLLVNINNLDNYAFPKLIDNNLTRIINNT